MVGVGVTEDESNGMWWSDTGVRSLAAPALAQDAFGRLVIAVVGEDGVPGWPGRRTGRG